MTALTNLLWSRRGKSAQPNGRLHALILTVVIACSSESAFSQAIEGVRVSRSNDTSIVENELGCMMRYVSHTQQAGGAEVHVKLSLGHDCRLPLHNVWNELRRPMNGRLANLEEIEFQRGERDNATLIMRFDRPLTVDVSQSLNVHLLTVAVREQVAEVNPEPQTPARAVTQAPSTVAQSKPIETRQVQRPSPTQRNLFVVRVAEIAPDSDIDYEFLEPYRSTVLYTNEVVVGERRWEEIRLGFYETEAEANTVLAKLTPRYPNAWITIANSTEQAAAQRSLLVWPSGNTEPQVSARATVVAPVEQAVASIPSDQISTLMSEAKNALVRENYTRSIQIYESLLSEPDHGHRRQAWEFLGVARQKNGETDQAIAEYEAYLQAYPEGSDAQRVRQRLAGISPAPVEAQAKPVSSLASNASPEATQARAPTSTWDIYGSASQYYLRGVNISEGSERDFVAQSAMLSQGHLVAKRRGERFDLVARANVGYLYDFADEGSSDQALVSYAYLDVDDTKTGIRARLGRQQQLAGGVLGRFDGLHASYQYKPDITVNVMTSFPVDSPRFMADGDISFYGASVDFDNLVGEFDFSFFANQQTVDGITDRQAIGGEVHFQNNQFNVVGLLDYDASYNVINTALLNAHWRLHDRISIHGRVRGGAAPFLTTRNAIVGQQVNTVRELFGTYTEGQIRRLARNRTADEHFVEGGLSAAVTERLQIRIDTSYLEYSATVASGGVAAIPESGPQYTYGGHLQGSGYIKPGHVMQLGYRHTETRRIDRDNVWVDLRYPFSEQLRIQARISLANHSVNQNFAGAIDQRVVNPLLRIVYSGDRSYRIEFEAGGRMSNQEFPLAFTPPLIPDGVLEQQDYYLQLGYTLDF